jgi:hypothetical protein
MLKKICSLTLVILFVCSCNNHKHEGPTTALDTGREFIRASLDGDFPAAEKLILPEDENLQLFQSYKLYYERLPEEKKKRYKDADYKINKYIDLNDSTSIINYSNDYMNKPMEIKIIRQNKEWKIDFKYTSSGNLPIN